MHTAVFTDFDGTAARRDVGYHIYHHFSAGRSEAVIPAWKAGEISSRECLLREAAMVEATERDFYAFLDTMVLNPGFVEFDRLCRANNVPLTILSDGLDLYIDHILKRHGLSHIPALCNRGRLSDGKLTIEFPYPPGACGRCGNCKGERIAEYRSAYAQPCRVVFIGDGLSDTCAIDQCDVLLAKKDLARYCEASNIPYTKFDTFFDVARVLVEQGYLTE